MSHSRNLSAQFHIIYFQLCISINIKGNMGDRFIQPLRDLWNQIQNVYYTNCTHTVHIYWDCFYLVAYRQVTELPLSDKTQRRIVTNYGFDGWVQQKQEQFVKRENYFDLNVNNNYLYCIDSSTISYVVLWIKSVFVSLKWYYLM